MLRRKNKIVGLINTVVGVLGCITFFLCYSFAKMEDKTFIYNTSEQESMATIFLIIIAIPVAFAFIINLIYIFRNWHNKKSMFMNILTIISIITPIVLAFVLEEVLYFFIISIVALWGILLLIFNRNEEEGKKHRILFGILILSTILFIVSSIGFLCLKSDFEIKYANNEKNMMKTIIQSSSNSNVAPIKAKKNGKWGYINSNGNTVIDFKYDDCSEFMEIVDSGTNNKFYITAVSEGNKLIIITNNGNQIASYKNKKRDYKVGASSIPYGLRDYLRNNAKSLNISVKFNESKYDSRYSYYGTEKEVKYNSSSDWGYNSNEDILSFDISNNLGKDLELSYNTKTESVTYNGRKISIDGKLYIYKEDDENNYYSKYDYNYIDTYLNGYVPIYNFEKEQFGWIDLKGQTHYINGKIQILDFNDKYLAVKDYSIQGYPNVYIMDYQGNRVSDIYKEITVLNKGYVVKKQNGKNTYLDENFKQITEDYDIIDTCRASDGILIVSNLQSTARNTGYGYYNTSYNLDIDNLKFDLININSGKVVGTNFESISGMSDNRYKANYYGELTNSEFLELLCSVDCDYLNTELYERYYK